MVARELQRIAGWRAGTDGDIGQEDEIELEAFALVQREDLDAGRVGFESQQFGVVLRIGFGHAPFELVKQGAQAEPCTGSGLQFLAELQIVGQAALAVDQTEQARCVFGANEIDRGERSLAFGARTPGLQAIGPKATLGFVLAEPANRCRVQTEQGRGQGRAQARVVGRRQQRVQQATQIGRFVAVVQAASSGRHAGNAGERQGTVDALGFVVAFDQHGDVAGAETAPAAVGTATQGAAGDHVGKQRVHARHAGRRGGVASRVDAGLGRSTQARHFNGRRHGIAEAIVFVGDPAGRLHRQVFDAAFGERLRTAASEQGRHRRDRRRPRAMVVRQRVPGIGLAARLEIGMHIAAAEAVDGLLRVADQEQRALAPPGVLAPLGRHRFVAEQVLRFAGMIGRAREQLPEDVPLTRIGVLEFVDEGDAVLSAQFAREGLALRPGQRIGDAEHHVVVADQSALALDGVEPRARVIARFVHERDASRLTLCFACIDECEPCIDGVE